MDCGKGEKSGCGLYHVACKLEALSRQLHGEKGTRMLRYNLTLPQSSLSISIDFRGIKRKGITQKIRKI